MFFLNPISLLCLLLSAFSVLSHKVPNDSERDMSPLVRFDAPEKATASMILLHGLGNTWNIYGAFPERYHSQERFRHINLVFPQAPIRNSYSYSARTGLSPTTHSWFNDSATGLVGGYNETQYWEIAEYIQDLVTNETLHGISPDRIVVGGISQGGMVTFGGIASVHTKIAGFVIFASMMPHNLTQFKKRLVFVNKETPIFHGHGWNDTLLAPREAIGTAKVFRDLGFNYHLRMYPGMGHQIDWEPNDRDVEEWVAKVLPKKWKKGWRE